MGMASQAEGALAAESKARQELEDLKAAANTAAAEIAAFKSQRLALQEELRTAYTKVEDLEGKFADADGQRRAFEGEARELKSQLLKRQLEVDAQLLVIHDKEREQVRLRADLEERTTEAIERQFRMALANDHVPSRPQTPKGTRPAPGRPSGASGPPASKRKPHSSAPAKRP